MVEQVFGGGGNSATGEIGWRCAQHAGRGGQSRDDCSGFVWHPEAQDHVQAVAEIVEAFGGDGEADIDLGVLQAECFDEGSYLIATDFDGSADVQRASWRVRRGGNFAFKLVYLGNDAQSVFIIDPTGFTRRKMPCIADHQCAAETLFQPREMTRYGCGRTAETARGRGQAPCFDERYEEPQIPCLVIRHEGHFSLKRISGLFLHFCKQFFSQKSTTRAQLTGALKGLLQQIVMKLPVRLTTTARRGLCRGDAMSILSDELVCEGEELRSRLIGTWELVSYKVEEKDTLRTIDAMGTSPRGRVIFTDSGWVAFNLEGSGREFSNTDAGRAQLMKTLVAYIGRYRIEGNCWITSVETAWTPDWVGTEQRRQVVLDGRDHADVVTPWRKMPNWMPDKLTRSIIRFRRATP